MSGREDENPHGLHDEDMRPAITTLLFALTLIAGGCPPYVDLDTATIGVISETLGETTILTMDTGMSSTSSGTSTGETTGEWTSTSETGPATTNGAWCSDGVKQGAEDCDVSVEGNDGAYGGCRPDCTFAAHCGDEVIDDGHEVCDGGDGCPADCGVSACAGLGG